MYKILLLEDDELLSETLVDFLSEEQFEIETAFNGEEVLELNFDNHYDLYLLDINVPKINGLDLLQQLRQAGDTTPAIYLTSYKDKATLKEGFLKGADDYLIKPVDPEELILRIQSLLKRCGKQFDNVILKENLVFNPHSRRLLQHNEDLNLPVKVILLLELCLENRGQIVTKDMIVNRLWHASEEYSEGSLRVYVNTLKKVLGKESVSNVKGVGYKVEF